MVQIPEAKHLNGTGFEGETDSIETQKEKALFKKCKPSAVTIRIYTLSEDTLDPDNADQRKPSLVPIASASGFFITEDGIIATNEHVVEDENLVYKIMLYTGKVLTAKVVCQNTDGRDIGMLKVEGTGYEPVVVGSSKLLEPGDKIMAIGSSWGVPLLPKWGRVIGASLKSNLADTKSDAFTKPYLKTDLSEKPGDSGEPIFNIKGELIGVCSRGHGGPQPSITGVSLEIPVDKVKTILQYPKVFIRMQETFANVSEKRALDSKDPESLGLDKAFNLSMEELLEAVKNYVQAVEQKNALKEIASDKAIQQGFQKLVEKALKPSDYMQRFQKNTGAKLKLTPGIVKKLAREKEREKERASEPLAKAA